MTGIPCRLCGAEALRPFQTIDRFTYAECEACGFRQVVETLGAEEIDAFYESGYGTLRHRMGQTVNAEVNTVVLDRLGVLERPSRVLDVGCGYGFLLERLRNRGWQNPVGVELSDYEAAYARDELGVDVRNSLAEVDERGFDLLLALEVVEHILNPVAFLREIASTVRPGGTVVIGTDNFRSWPIQAMGTAFPKWIPHEHISLFDAATLPILVEMAGLRLERTFSFTPWELLAKASVYRLTGGRVGGHVFTLENVRHGGDDRPYPLFGLRTRANRHWVNLTLAKDLHKEMMIVSARVPEEGLA